MRLNACIHCWCVFYKIERQSCCLTACLALRTAGRYDLASMSESNDNGDAPAPAAVRNSEAEITPANTSDTIEVESWLAALPDRCVRPNKLQDCPYISVEISRALSHYLQSGRKAACERLIAFVQEHGIALNGKHTAAMLLANEERPLDFPLLNRVVALISPEDRTVMVDVFNGAGGSSVTVALLKSSGELGTLSPEMRVFDVARCQGQL